MGGYWPGDVLDLLFAHILERKIELIAHLIAHDAADADPPWLPYSFETGREIDATAINVFVVNDDVANVQTNTKLDTPFWRDLGVALGHLPLDIDSTAYTAADTGKLSKKAVARRLNDARTVFRDLRVDDCASVALERGQRAFFIQAHQPRIAHDIPRENGREAALDRFSAHGAPPKPAGTSCAQGWRRRRHRGKDKPRAVRGCRFLRRSIDGFHPIEKSPLALPCSPRRGACLSVLSAAVGGGFKDQHRATRQSAPSFCE